MVTVPARARRQPPPFRRVVVSRKVSRSPRLVRITLAGAELEGLGIEEPASSVRVLLPSPGTSELVMPTWTGNEYLSADGRRPMIRTLTPRRSDPAALELDIEIVLHGAGVASGWAEAAQPGDPAAVSGPARGYTIDDEAPAFLVAGDETAIPAISQLLEALPRRTPVQVDIEIAAADGRLVLPDHPHAIVRWSTPGEAEPPGATLVAAIRGADLAPGVHVWAAGEAAAMQRIRRYLFEERALPRAQAWVRGYWKHGRAGEAPDEP
jgi:NADPH-dependent ferric siderophore reductase